MVTFRTILHPTDFSSDSEKALELAGSLARAHNARLMLVHAWQADDLVLPDAAEVEENLLKKLFMLTTPTSVTIEHYVVQGKPAAEILRLAKETRADLIVMGTHGRTGLRRLLLGSVAEQVSRNAPCPVMTVSAGNIASNLVERTAVLVKEEHAANELPEADLRQAALLMAEARELMKSRCYLPALVKLEEVTAVDPFHIEALQALADAHEKLGHPEKAEAFRQRVRHLLYHEEVSV
jgi:nucleotide-binding universal stress UspA family protein